MNKIGRRAMLCLAGVLLLVPASAQQTQVYTLDECIRQALTNNVRIKQADNEVEAARHTAQEAFTNYFPNVSASGSGFMADKGLLQLNMGPGMEMSLMKKGVMGGVTVAMPLFAGGQIVNGNKLAETGVEVSRLQRRQSGNEVRLTTERYFWQIVMLKEKQKTLSIVETQLESIRKDAEAAVTAGVANRNDLLQVQLKANEMRSNRIQVENALAVSRNLLAQYVGHAEGGIDVMVAQGDSLPDSPEGLFRKPESVMTLTNEYRLLQQNVKANQLQYRMAVGKNLPTLAIGGGYMYDNLMEKDHPFWVGFATVSIPISGWWGGSHDMKKQRLKLRNAEYQLTDGTQLLAIRMQNAWNETTNAYKQVEIALQSIDQSAENLRLQQDYYTAGTCTMSDLLQAQTLYQQSRDRYVEAYAQYEIKKREYLQATAR